MKVKVKISKKALYKLALIAIIGGLAFTLDFYFENNSDKIGQGQEENNKTGDSQESFVFFDLSNNINVKPVIQKTPCRLIHSRLHDKFLQKHHQLQNYHALKGEPPKQKTPLFLSYHFIVFRHSYSSLPDDGPFVS